MDKRIWHTVWGRSRAHPSHQLDQWSPESDLLLRRSGYYEEEEKELEGISNLFMWLWSVPRIAHVNWAKVNPSAGTMDPQIECRGGGRQSNKEPTEEALLQSTWWFRGNTQIQSLLWSVSSRKRKRRSCRGMQVLMI